MPVVSLSNQYTYTYESKWPEALTIDSYLIYVCLRHMKDKANTSWLLQDWSLRVQMSQTFWSTEAGRVLCQCSTRCSVEWLVLSLDRCQLCQLCQLRWHRWCRVSCSPVKLTLVFAAPAAFIWLMQSARCLTLIPRFLTPSRPATDNLPTVWQDGRLIQPENTVWQSVSAGWKIDAFFTHAIKRKMAWIFWYAVSYFVRLARSTFF